VVDNWFSTSVTVIDSHFTVDDNKIIDNGSEIFTYHDLNKYKYFRPGFSAKAAGKQITTIEDCLA